MARRFWLVDFGGFLVPDSFEKNVILSGIFFYFSFTIFLTPTILSRAAHSNILVYIKVKYVKTFQNWTCLNTCSCIEEREEKKSVKRSYPKTSHYFPVWVYGTYAIILHG